MADAKDNQRQELSADLLGYHLGLADEQTRARVEAAFADARQLAAARSAVQKALAPLEAVPPPVLPADLVARILGRVAEAKNTLPMQKPRKLRWRRAAAAQPRAAVPQSGTAGRPVLAMREIVGLAAAILIFVGIFVPGSQTARSAAQRIACADNLRMIGNGYTSYAEMYGSEWPFAGAMPARASWAATPDRTTPQVSNSRHVYVLVRGRFTPPEAFACPARPADAPLPPDAVQQFDDFPGLQNNSYSTTFVIRPSRRDEFEPNAPLAADMTPLLDPLHRIVSAAAASLNSDSHGKSKGQNVVRADLSARFFRTPRVGVDDDDIYRLIGVEQYTGLERPTLKSDAFLVP
jgi:hypothetical protein